MDREIFLKKAEETGTLGRKINSLDLTEHSNPEYFLNIIKFLRMAAGWAKPSGGEAAAKIIGDPAALITKTASDIEIFSSALSGMDREWTDERKATFFANKQKSGFLSEEPDYIPSEILPKGSDILDRTLKIIEYVQTQRPDILREKDDLAARTTGRIGTKSELPTQQEVQNVILGIAKIADLVANVTHVSREMAGALANDKDNSFGFVIAGKSP